MFSIPNFSITKALAKQTAIAQKNDLTYQMLANSQAQRNMLNQNLSFEGAHQMETALAMENIDNSVQLMAVNAELNALNNTKLDYMA